MKRALRPWWARAILVCVVALTVYFIFTLIGLILYDRVCYKDYYTEQKHCPYYDILSAFVLNILFLVERHNALVTATAGAAVAVFTGTLWRSTKRLWETGERQRQEGREGIAAATAAARAATHQAELAAQTFIATHRPKLHVRVVRRVSDNAAAFWRGAVTVVNIGGSPAELEHVQLFMALRNPSTREWCDVPLTANPPTIIVDPVLGVGSSRYEWILSKISGEVPTDKSGNTGELCAWGEYRYRDGNGERRTTGFMWVWDAKFGRFERSDEPEFSYED